jgi:hypothetical protein
MQLDDERIEGEKRVERYSRSFIERQRVVVMTQFNMCNCIIIHTTLIIEHKHSVKEKIFLIFFKHIYKYMSQFFSPLFASH